MLRPEYTTDSVQNYNTFTICICYENNSRLKLLNFIFFPENQNTTRDINQHIKLHFEKTNQNAPNIKHHKYKSPIKPTGPNTSEIAVTVLHWLIEVTWVHCLALWSGNE